LYSLVKKRFTRSQEERIRYVSGGGRCRREGETGRENARRGHRRAIYNSHGLFGSRAVSRRRPWTLRPRLTASLPFRSLWNFTRAGRQDQSYLI
jgi:hypothetical protein